MCFYSKAYVPKDCIFQRSEKLLGEYIYIYVSLSFEKPFWNCICVSFDGICRKEANGKAKVEASI